MSTVIENPAKSSECVLCVVYHQTLMSEGVFYLYKNWKTYIHEEERNGTKCIVNDELVQKMYEKDL